MHHRRLPARLLAPALAIAAFALPSLPAGANPLSSLAARTVSSAAPTTLAALPVTLHRRAVDLLEERRDLDDSPWIDATLRPAVVPMYRPGEAQPAYIEVSVEGPDGTPRGFMVLSTGEHDAPVVHLSTEGEAPSRALADAASNGRRVARTYRLSYDAYVAEDAAGRMLAKQGYLPGKVIGFDRAWLAMSDAQRHGSMQWDPERGVTQQTTPAGEGLRFEPWDSWSDLKAEYADNRVDFHAVDRRNAAEAWQVERTLAANGETLQNGQFREVPLLADRGRATVTLAGAGAAAVRTETGERGIEGDVALRVLVDSAPAQTVAPLDIAVHYADGSHEVVRMGVIEQLPHRFDPAPESAEQRATDVLGFAPSAKEATGALVSRRVAALNAPGIACSKAIVHTPSNSVVHRVGTSLKSNGTWRTDDTLVRIEYSGTGEVAFRANNNRYVRAVGGGGGDIAVDATAKGTHERFRLFQQRSDHRYYGLQTHDRRHFVNFDWTGHVDARATNARASSFTVEYCQPRRIYERWAGSNAADALAKTRKYDQLPAHSAPSTSQCASGCGATAWAMLFGFHDYEASAGSPKWAAHKALFLKDGKSTGPDAAAPEWFWPGDAGRLTHSSSTPVQPGAAAMVWEISQVINDWVLAGCAPNGQKWTAPVLMGKAHIYLQRRNVKAKLISDYDGASIMTHEGKTKAYAVIKSRQPVVIGIGHLSHYPLAVGRDRTEYRVWDRGAKRWSDKADRRHFVVSMGWGRPNLETVPYGTWMAGSLQAPTVNSAASAPAVAAPKPKPAKPTHLPTTTTVHNPTPMPKPIGGPIPQPNW